MQRLVLVPLVLALVAPAALGEPSVSAPPVVVRLDYVASGESVFPFSVFLAPPVAGRIETRWLFSEGVAIEAATFEEGSRALDGGVTSFLWVNPEDVDVGFARLGHDTAYYAGTDYTPAVWLFHSPMAEYVFDARTGWLLHATDLLYARSLTLVGVGVSPALPPAMPGPARVDHRWDALDPEGMLQDAAAMREGAGALGAVGTAYKGCGSVVRWVFGGDSSCGDGFDVGGSFHIDEVHVGFPALATGRVLGTLSNPAGKAYHEWACVAKSPRNDLAGALLAAECHDAPLLPTDKVKTGAHTLAGAATFEFCLNPTHAFSCAWDVQATLSGAVS